MFLLAACTLQQRLGVAQETAGVSDVRELVEESERSERVVGGVDATIEERPWQAALLYTNRYQENIESNFLEAHFCGAVLIHPSWLLTAAHCIKPRNKPEMPKEHFFAIYGTDKLNNSGVRRTITDIKLRGDYKPESDNAPPYADLALLKLKVPIYDNAVADIGADALISQASIDVIVSGWGQLGDYSSKSRQLQKATLPVRSIETCNRQESYNGNVNTTNFCAGFREGGIDACKGDSGGPVTVHIGEKAFLVGIVSWGKRCGYPRKYGVYARVPMFLKWITETVKQTQGGA